MRFLITGVWSATELYYNELFYVTGVQYYTGQFFDLKRITEVGHKKV